MLSLILIYTIIGETLVLLLLARRDLMVGVPISSPRAVTLVAYWMVYMTAAILWPGIVLFILVYIIGAFRK